MRTVKLFASFMALALTGGAALAADAEPVQGLLLSGDLSTYVGYSDASDPTNEFDDTSALLYGGFASASIPLGANFSAQVDLFGEDNDVDTDDDGTITYFGTGGHLSWRNPNSGLIGLYGGTGRVDTNGDSADVLWVGAEGQYYFDAMTLYGQIGWASGNSTHDPLDWNDVFVRGVARYYIDDNFMLQGDLSYTQAVIHDDNMDSYGWGAEAKYGLGDMPVYLSLEYRGAHYDAHGEGSSTEHIGLVGLSVAFGASSLLQQDRYGATLDTSSLPIRASAFTDILD